MMFVCVQYVGSGVLSELDNPDATRLAIANIREVSFTAASNLLLGFNDACFVFC